MDGTNEKCVQNFILETEEKSQAQTDDIIKTDIKETGFGGVDSILMAEDKVQLRLL